MLADARVLWPPLPCHPCPVCGIPRRPGRAAAFRTCYRCRELHDLYGDSLAAVHPLTLTTRDWPLGAALRRFKDELGASPDTDCARGFGAALSAYLEARFCGPDALLDAQALVSTVPSSRPAVAAALQRAAREGPPPDRPALEPRPSLRERYPR